MEPTPTPIAPTSSLGSTARALLGLALALVSLGALLVAIWPGAIRLLPGQETFDPISAAPARFGAFVLFGAASVGRVLLRTRRAHGSAAWQSLAAETGGTYREEKRRPTLRGWEGGPAVTWSARGGTVRLSKVVEQGSAAAVQLTADRVLRRGFQFQVCAQNFLTKALTSPKLWQVVIAGVKQSGDPSLVPEARARLATQLSFLAGRDVEIGDPEFDAAFILKTDDEAKAREFFADAGVRQGLRELAGASKGWMFTLMTGGGSDPYHLVLQGPGVGPGATLKSAHSLMVSALDRLDASFASGTESRRVAS